MLRCVVHRPIPGHLGPISVGGPAPGVAAARSQVRAKPSSKPKALSFLSEALSEAFYSLSAVPPEIGSFNINL
jgi:hypothetical protein